MCSYDGGILKGEYGSKGSGYFILMRFGKFRLTSFLLSLNGCFLGSFFLVLSLVVELEAGSELVVAVAAVVVVVVVVVNTGDPLVLLDALVFDLMVWVGIGPPWMLQILVCLDREI